MLNEYMSPLGVPGTILAGPRRNNSGARYKSPANVIYTISFNQSSQSFQLLTLAFRSHGLNVECVLMSLFECIQTKITQFNHPSRID